MPSTPMSGLRSPHEAPVSSPSVASAVPGTLALSVQITSEQRRSLLEPLLLQLREENGGHLWQPPLAAVPAQDVYSVFLRMVREGRPSTIFTYYLSLPGVNIPVGVAAVSSRVAEDCPEDGIMVLGRAYVRPEFRRQSLYLYTLRHRLQLCQARFGRQLLGVHIGTSSTRVEAAFRDNFPGRTLFIGEEDLGRAGMVRALIGLTEEYDRQVAQAVPAALAEEHRTVLEFSARGAGAMSCSDVMPALGRLAEYQDAYRIFHQFLGAMPRLR